MSRSAAVRLEIEERLAAKVPGALTPRVHVERVRLGTGQPVVDALTGGGFPVGAITEIVGVECSGRTTLAMSFLASRMADGMVGAWVDATDSLDPESAAAAGVDLERMLWVRCGCSREEGSARARVPRGSGAAMVDRSRSAPSLGGGCGSPHPRSEGKGLPKAIEGLMGGLAAELMGVETRGAVRVQQGGNKALLPPKRKNKWVGTPSAPNRAAGAAASGSEFSWRSKNREEQVATDRLPGRRGEMVTKRWEPRCAGEGDGSKASANSGVFPLGQAHGQDDGRRQATTVARGTTDTGASPFPFRRALLDPGSVKMKVVDGVPVTPMKRAEGRPWRGVDQALRAVDMLLQAGGFAVIVLDLGGVEPEMVWRIPAATWFRFRGAADRSRVCFVVLTQHSCARSSAELVLEMQPGVMEGSGRVMAGVAYQARVGRQRFVAEEKVVAIRGTGRDGSFGDEANFEERRPPQPERAGVWHGTAAWAKASGVADVRAETGEGRLRGRSGRAR